MWIASKFGFYSIVDKPNAGAGPRYHIRARTAEDLDRLKDAAGLDEKVEFWAGADYKFRILTDNNGLVKAMLALAYAVDYPNFKNKVAATDHQRPKLEAYHRLWKMLIEAFDPDQVFWGRGGDRF